MVCTACLLYFLWCINKNCRAATWLTDGQIGESADIIGWLQLACSQVNRPTGGRLVNRLTGQCRQENRSANAIG